MRISATLIVAGLLLAPGMAAAQGCSYEKTTAQSCAPGNVLDAETGTCVPEATG